MIDNANNKSKIKICGNNCERNKWTYWFKHGYFPCVALFTNLTFPSTIRVFRASFNSLDVFLICDCALFVCCIGCCVIVVNGLLVSTKLNRVNTAKSIAQLRSDESDTIPIQEKSIALIRYRDILCTRTTLINTKY